MVTLQPCVLETRPLGKRRGYVISYEAILQAAAEIEARKQRAEREVRHKEKRRGGRN